MGAHGRGQYLSTGERAQHCRRQKERPAHPETYSENHVAGWVGPCQGLYGVISHASVYSTTKQSVHANPHVLRSRIEEPALKPLAVVESKLDRRLRLHLTRVRLPMGSVLLRRLSLHDLKRSKGEHDRKTRHTRQVPSHTRSNLIGDPRIIARNAGPTSATNRLGSCGACGNGCGEPVKASRMFLHSKTGKARRLKRSGFFR